MGGGAGWRSRRASDGTFERGDDGRFNGEVWLRSTLAAEDGTNVGIVHFSPEARTHWHQHPGGQFLYGVSGRGRVRSRGEAGRVLEPGDVIHVGGGEWHFHGASETPRWCTSRSTAAERRSGASRSRTPTTTKASR